MKIEDYLKQGGVLTSPENAPPRYRAELLRLMATFVDSELAAAAGFANMINAGPGIAERAAAARIVMEKTQHAGKVLKIMGDFGANTEFYVGSHPWADRLERDADIGATRRAGDMRLSVFNYPLDGWVDAVMMHLLMGLAVEVQLREFSRVSYAPLAEAFREIAPVEATHTESAEKGLFELHGTGTPPIEMQASADYWWPRVAASFGHDVSARAALLADFGLRHETNASLRATWEKMAEAVLGALGLQPPKEQG
jgi:1,2-phenylacetyl-CoA epoxidase catalytic subunit